MRNKLFGASFGYALAFQLVAGSALDGDQASLRKLDRALRQAVDTRTDGSHRTIVHARPGRLAALRAWLLAHGDIIDGESPSLGTIITRLSPGHLAAVAELTDSDRLSFDAPVAAFGGNFCRSRSGRDDRDDQGDPAPTVLRTTLGLDQNSATGNGIGVAVIDSGIEPSADFDHRVLTMFDFVNAGGRRVAPYDDYGHGTHVAGLIGSNGVLGPEFTGVAPNVRLIALKVLDANGQGHTSDVITAIMFAIDNRRQLGIDIINLSLGHPILEPAESDPLVQAVEAAVQAGIVVVTAAGNFGMNPETGMTGYAGITSPG